MSPMCISGMPAPASSQAQPRAATATVAASGSTQSRRLASIFVVAAHPERPAAAFVATLGHDVEVSVVEVERLDAAREGRVRTEHAAFRVLREHAHALALGGVGVLELEVVESFLLLHLLGSERHVEVE